MACDKFINVLEINLIRGYSGVIRLAEALDHY